MIQEVRRVLKKGGMLVLTAPYGVPRVNQHQRVYGGQALEELLRGFKIEETRYFRNLSDRANRCNLWVQTSRQEASQIDSLENTECVCLIKAKRQS